MQINISKQIKTLSIAFAFLAAATTSFGQRLATVDVNRILESIEEYQAAQSELDRLASKWRQEIA